MTRYAMLVNIDRCAGCNACTMACTMHHGLPADVRWSHVNEFTLGTWPDLELVELQHACMQCTNPSCVAVCPTGASSIREEDGIVVIDQSVCIGCGSCIQACPYGARVLLDKTPASNHGEEGPTVFEEATIGAHVGNTVEKCDFCIDRLEQGLQPACVQNCTADARLFGDLDDADSAIAKAVAAGGLKQLLVDEGTEPNVYFRYSGSGDLDKLFKEALA